MKSKVFKDAIVSGEVILAPSLTSSVLGVNEDGNPDLALLHGFDRYDRRYNFNHHPLDLHIIGESNDIKPGDWIYEKDTLSFNRAGLDYKQRTSDYIIMFTTDDQLTGQAAVDKQKGVIKNFLPIVLGVKKVPMYFLEKFVELKGKVDNVTIKDGEVMIEGCIKVQYEKSDFNKEYPLTPDEAFKSPDKPKWVNRKDVPPVEGEIYIIQNGTSEEWYTGKAEERLTDTGTDEEYEVRFYDVYDMYYLPTPLIIPKFNNK